MGETTLRIRLCQWLIRDLFGEILYRYVQNGRFPVIYLKLRHPLGKWRNWGKCVPRTARRPARDDPVARAATGASEFRGNQEPAQRPSADAFFRRESRAGSPERLPRRGVRSQNHGCRSPADEPPTARPLSGVFPDAASGHGLGLGRLHSQAPPRQPSPSSLLVSQPAAGATRRRQNTRTAPPAAVPPRRRPASPASPPRPPSMRRGRVQEFPARISGCLRIACAFAVAHSVDKWSKQVGDGRAGAVRWSDDRYSNHALTGFVPSRLASRSA